MNGASGGASGGTVVTFDELADTPSTKAGQAKKVCFVDAGEETMAFASNLFWDEVNGRLGVGGATPDGDFELRQQRVGDVTGYITNTSPSASARSLLLLRSSAAPSYAGGLILTNDSYTAVPSWASSLIFNTDSGVVGGMKFRAADGDIRFSTSGLEATDLVVDNIGWVGINGSPSHLFDVNGEAHSQATVANLDSAAGSALITKNFFEDKNRYGEMYVDTGGTLTLNIATSTSIANRRVGTNYVQWTNSVNGESFGITPLNGVFTMAADGAGKYEVDVTASFTGVNTTNYFMAIFVNGIIDAGGVQARKVGNGSDLGNMSTQGVVAVSAAQTIDIRFAGDSTGNLIINELNIKIRYIGE
ncbi:MAG: hypothetical protein GY770_35700 [Aestuariibacter sp.]|nr:hypothetical protein [Aestuariibacter sp.]